MTRAPLLAALALVPALALASPEPEYELRAAPLTVGDDWEVRMSTRVEEDPLLAARRILKSGGEYTETSAEVRYRILAEDDRGRIQLESTRAPQTVVARIAGQETREVAPEEKVVKWGKPDELLPGEVGPASLLARERTRVGDSWICEANLPVGGLAPVRVRFVYKVGSARKSGAATILRVTCEGSGSVEAEDGSKVTVSAQGVLHVDPARVDRPHKVVLVYRVKVTGGDAPTAATRTTVRLSTSPR